MAKEKPKNPAELPVEEKLKRLYELQTLLSKIDDIKTLRGELPLEVQDLEDEVVGLSTRIEKMQNEILELRREVIERKKSITEDEENLARYEEQLKGVRNNREYDALNKEIEFQQLDIELHQKKIGEAEAAIEQKTADVAQCSADVKERRADLDVKKSELDEIISETRAEEEKLRDRARNTEMYIEPRLLASYKRIRKNSRNGLGIVYVQRDACGGCFNKIPPQRQLDIRMRKKIIVCEYCGRIMIDPELAGVQLGKPAEEQPKPKRRASSRAKKAAEAPKTEAAE